MHVAHLYACLRNIGETPNVDIRTYAYVYGIPTYVCTAFGFAVSYWQKVAHIVLHHITTCHHHQLAFYYRTVLPRYSACMKQNMHC
jgi:hypothetical protein